MYLNRRYIHQRGYSIEFGGCLNERTRHGHHIHHSVDIRNDERKKNWQEILKLCI